MNFLAHLFLSGDQEPVIVGNFLGDFLKNNQVALLPPAIREGVWLHRKIDTFTDEHPAIRRSTALLRPVHGKYAPVILDVLLDFLLAKNWERYSLVGLNEFAGLMYVILKRHLYLMPGFLQERLPLMIADDWLVRYGTEDGLRFTFSRMKLRTSLPDLFEHAFESLQTHLAPLEEDFNAFFPDAIEEVKGWHLRSS